jgi:hypothetical protein
MIQTVDIGLIKENPDNPRKMSDNKYEKLVQSLREFPEMSNVRPIVVNKDMVILGGNYRYRAMLDAGWTKAPVVVVDWPEEKQREFIIKDNLSYGEWDFNALSSDWDKIELEEWGLDLSELSIGDIDIDYSVLDDGINQDVDKKLREMSSSHMRGILIEFKQEHYKEAFDLIKYWRSKGAYVGLMIMEYLTEEKKKHEAQ